MMQTIDTDSYRLGRDEHQKMIGPLWSAAQRVAAAKTDADLASAVDSLRVTFSSLYGCDEGWFDLLRRNGVFAQPVANPVDA